MRMLMSSLARTVCGFLLLVGAISGAKPAKADLLVSNLTSSHGSVPISLSYSTTYAQYGAQQFTTGSQSTNISQVSVLLGDATATYSGTIVAELLNQVGNLNYNPPGSTVLQTFATTQTLGADGLQINFTPTSSYTLAANTGYWFALGTTSTSTGSLDWTKFNDPVTTTGSGTIYDEYTFGAAALSTGGRTGGEWSLAINGSPVSVPEQSSAVIAAFGTLIVSGYWWCRRRSVPTSNPQ